MRKKKSNIFKKQTNWTRHQRPEFNTIESIMVFASGNSVSKLNTDLVRQKMQDPRVLTITMNYGQAHPMLATADYCFMTDSTPMFWARRNLKPYQIERVVAHRTNAMTFFNYYFPAQVIGCKPKFTLTYVLLCIRAHPQFVDTPIYIYGLDLYESDGMKFYDQYIDSEQDQVKSRQDPEKYWQMCSDELDKMLGEQGDIYNGNKLSAYSGFPFASLI